MIAPLEMWLMAFDSADSRVKPKSGSRKAIDFLPVPVQANSLTDAEDVPFIESFIECRTTMS